METKTLKVSAQTQGLIECLCSLSNLWGQVDKVLAGIYGERQAQEIMDKDYNDAQDKLRQVISSFLLDSIDDNIADINFTEI